MGSVVLHVLAILLAAWFTAAAVGPVDPSLFPGSGPPGGGGGGGSSGAGDQLTYFYVADAPPQPESQPVPPEPEQPQLVIPVLEVKEIELPKQDLPKIVATVPVTVGNLAQSSSSGATGTGDGGGAGSGSGTGVGPGSGGGTGGGNGGGVGTGNGPGTGGRMWPPSPMALMLPPKAPGSVRGQSVTVRLAVDSAGIVQAVELVPATGDSGFDKKLREIAKQWLFRPARDPSGRAIAAAFEAVFRF